jgi:hypothetical protein
LSQTLANVQKVVKYPNLVVQPGEVAELRGEEERLGVAEVEDSPVAAGLPEVVADQGEASLRGVVAADLLLGVAVDLLLGVEVDSGVVADPFGSCSKPFTFFLLGIQERLQCCCVISMGGAVHAPGFIDI